MNIMVEAPNSTMLWVDPETFKMICDMDVVVACRPKIAWGVTMDVVVRDTIDLAVPCSMDLRRNKDSVARITALSNRDEPAEAVDTLNDPWVPTGTRDQG
jgi:hypothetical protein